MAKQAYEKEYIKTLESMDAKTLDAYMGTYYKKAVELQEQLSSVFAELSLMRRILSKTLKKEKK